MTKSSFCTWRHKGGDRDRDGTKECLYPGDGLGDGEESVEEGVREDRGRGKEGSWKEQLKLETVFATPTILPGFLLAADLKSNPVHLRQCQFHSGY